MKKKAVVVLSVLAVLVLGGGFAGQAWLKSALQKESLVAQMENKWNCRAHLDDATVSLYSRPAEVRLTGLRLAPRDAEVEKPLAERAALAPDAAQVIANEVVLSVELTDLFRGTLNVDRLNIDGLDVRNVNDAEGRGSLDVLFRSPDADDPGSAPKADTVTGGAGGAADSVADKAAKPKRARLRADKLKLNLAVKSAGVSNARFESTDLKGGTKTTVEHLAFSLSDIDVAPGDLAGHNFARFEFSGALRHDKTDQQLVMANFTIDGSGTVKPFDPKTGEWMPDADLNVTMKQGGLLGGMTLEKQMSKKDLEKFAKKGIHFGDIALGGVLSEDAATRVHALPGGKLIVKQSTRFAFPQYEIIVEKDSWIAPPLDLHNVKARLIVSPELSARIVEDAKKMFAEDPDAPKSGILEATAAAAAPWLTDLVASGLMDEKKRLVIPYRAKGKMSDPKPDFGGLWDDVKGDMLNKVLNNLFPVKGEEKKEEGKKDEDNKPAPVPQQ